MAKFELKFLCSRDPEGQDFIKTNYEYLENSILIHLNMDGEDGYVFLDKSTAIKFAKTLRTEINKITESEVNNG